MNRRGYLDLLERVAWTAVQAFGASMLVTGFDDLGLSLKIGGAAAGAAVLKCLVAINVGDSTSPAALPGVTGNTPP